ncbi:carboxylating nicotinate-nucleotide diphosphorylase [Temperatibacter marinus]|uniref:Probable nicotinate-nucleotide pyrophosphorylase [carboxylating] n=1 Tax=Temperatibacter marinus TaxID=1456591 RepID=A0AA52HAZ9_9PROT|nr:carboxylating nicotinate-nucleotide diphosphorylase [Temperatibacter marinus]WND03260.1 carboxylating nicotinate-nucleotide diphosphorylase [Temperatibacter marinus]
MSDFPLSIKEINSFIERAFDEDIASGDLTAFYVIPEEAKLKAVMNARHSMTVAGLPLAEAIFLSLDPRAECISHVEDGLTVNDGDPIMTISGNARALLSAERTALNSVQHLSGIATLTSEYVAAMGETKAKLLDTRKTTPGLRKLEKYAVKMGGGTNHRMGLYDAIMIKDNHLAVAGSVEQAIAAAKKSGRSDIQVECDTLDQVREAVEAGANSLLLDNMPPKVLSEALKIVDGRISCEASGGVTLDTIGAIAATGVDFISVGRLTQSAPAVDIGLDYSEV